MPQAYERSVRRTLGRAGLGGLKPWVTLAGLSVALLWSYWPIMARLYREWQHDDNYSVGQLVPLAAIYLLWQERRVLGKCRWSPCWWGVGLIVFAQAVRGVGLTAFYESAERYAFVLTVAGMVLLVAGREVFRQVRWILLFLFLMVPLPGRVHNLISSPLQNLATGGAVFTLELCGVTVLREGNVMVLNNAVSVAVAEACSGLRMLTAFIVVAAVLAYLVRRPPWQKAILVLSSVPVAIVCNLARLVVTAFLYLTVSSETAEHFFHDFAGLTMMPLAVLVLMAELWIMKQLVIEESRGAVQTGL